MRLIREVYRGGTNLYTLLAIAAARWPDRTAIIDDDGAVNYRDLRAKTESLAQELAGIGTGQAVGIMCRNGRDFPAAVFAAALVGADVVLVSTEFRADALAGALDAHQIATMFCDNEFAEKVRDASASVRVIDPATVPTQPGKRQPKVVASGRLVLLTSGTTGVPKGVPRSPRMSSGLGVGMTILQRTGLRVGSRIAVAVPMFHGLGLGMLMLTVSLGGTALTHRRFDAEAVLAQASLQRADAQVGIVRNDLNALKANYQDMQAQIKQAQYDIDYYDREFRRQQDLASRQVASQQTFDTARRNLQTAQQKLASLNQQLAAIAANLNGDPNIPIEKHPRYIDAVAHNRKSVVCYCPPILRDIAIRLIWTNN